MRFLLYISLIAILSGCKTLYESVPEIEGDVTAVQKFRPVYNTILYQAQVDVAGRHLSGILLMKQMPDTSRRIVFSNEMGIKYFDLEFRNDGTFNVIYIMKKMDRKPVINTLKKDFELILFEGLDYSNAYIRQDSLNRYYIFPHNDEIRYYIWDINAQELMRMESGSKSKILVKAEMKNYFNGVPDTIAISHSNFKFDIGLKRLIR